MACVHSLSFAFPRALLAFNGVFLPHRSDITLHLHLEKLLSEAVSLPPCLILCSPFHHYAKQKTYAYKKYLV